MAIRKDCLTPGCPRPHRARGLCKVCFESARVIVEAGENSWERLEAVGLAKPKLKRSELRRSRFRFDPAAYLETQAS